MSAAEVETYLDRMVANETAMPWERHPIPSPERGGVRGGLYSQSTVLPRMRSGTSTQPDEGGREGGKILNSVPLSPSLPPSRERQ